MELYIESVENGPLIWPSIEENRVTRPKKYSELSATKAINLTVMSKQEISFSKDYHRRFMHCLAIIKSPRNFGKELNFLPILSSRPTNVEVPKELPKVSMNSVNSSEPTPSNRPTKVEVPKELPKVSMVNTSLKILKPHLARFDVVVKERTTAIALTEGT
nr:hypothetical protein [Tanacetum cinerariifolium]